MLTEFRLPELGESIESADVLSVLVSVGDTILPEQSVLEVETDKATIEIPSSVVGIVREIFVKEGEKVAAGAVILSVDTDAELKEASEMPEKKPNVSMNEEETEIVVVTQNEKKEPTGIEETVHQPKPGKIIEFGRAPVASQPDISRKDTPATPSVRRVARELGVDINQVAGSGPAGRISIEDVKTHVRRRITETVKSGNSSLQIPAAPLPDFAKWGDIEHKPMSNVRRKTAENMSYAWSTVAHVTQYDKADVTELDKLRKSFGKKVEAAGGKLTVTAIVLKVIASALKIFPKFNASLDVKNNEIIYKKYYHIGVAVDTDHGLLVPVIREVEKKNILQLSVELTQAAEKARSRKLSLEEMQGGTFTITNLGGIGGTNFSPIVYAPQVAILGISRASVEPVFTNGQFEPRSMMPLSVSYDHRLIDGADAARFLRWVVEALEQPFLLTLEG